MSEKRTHATAPRRIRSLRETLAYKNDQVVYKFMERYKLSFRQASDIFTETKRWLWLCARARVDAPAIIPLTLIGMTEMWIIDEMWHTFVLFTPVYHQFCDHYFGRYIHHMPSTREEQEREAALRRADPEKYEQEQLASLRQQLLFVGKKLGPTTIRKWFTTFGRRYTPEAMDRLRLPHARPAAREISTR